jgi:hypothetical protein
MEYQVELIKISKEGSPYYKSKEEIYVLVLQKGKIAEVGDLVIGRYGLTRVSSVYERDYFDARIYYLEDGTNLVSPRKVIAREEDLSPDQLQQIKDLEGPLFVRLEESGKIEIIK